jgi:hypothetical protein
MKANDFLLSLSCLPGFLAQREREREREKEREGERENFNSNTVKTV